MINKYFIFTYKLDTNYVQLIIKGKIKTTKTPIDYENSFRFSNILDI